MRETVRSDTLIDQTYANALQAASAKGHEKVVQMLLDRGVEYEDTIFEARKGDGYAIAGRRNPL